MLNRAAVNLSVSGALLTQANPIITPTEAAFNWAVQAAVATGTTTGKADRIIAQSGTVGSGADIVVDVSGSLKDPVGDSNVLVEVTGIFFANKADPVANPTFWMTLGGHATAALIGWVGAANDVLRVGPGGFAAIYNPSDPAYPVTATTADIVRIAADVVTASAYELVILGRSA